MDPITAVPGMTLFHILTIVVGLYTGSEPTEYGWSRASTTVAYHATLEDCRSAARAVDAAFAEDEARGSDRVPKRRARSVCFEPRAGNQPTAGFTCVYNRRTGNRPQCRALQYFSSVEECKTGTYEERASSSYGGIHALTHCSYVVLHKSRTYDDPGYSVKELQARLTKARELAEKVRCGLDPNDPYYVPGSECVDCDSTPGGEICENLDADSPQSLPLEVSG